MPDVLKRMCTQTHVHSNPWLAVEENVGALCGVHARSVHPVSVTQTTDSAPSARRRARTRKPGSRQDFPRLGAFLAARSARLESLLVHDEDVTVRRPRDAPANAANEQSLQETRLMRPDDDQVGSMLVGHVDDLGGDVPDR